VTARRRKTYLTLFILIGVYGAFFSMVVFSMGRDNVAAGGRGAVQSDATAQDISCAPNWFVLGAVSRCRATVVKPDGTRYPFSSFANELSADDVGREVAMTEYKQKKSRRATGAFYPSRTYPVNTLGMVFGFFGSIGLAVVGPMVLWARKPKSAPAP
jgi:hypothetical protein